MRFGGAGVPFLTEARRFPSSKEEFVVSENQSNTCSVVVLFKEFCGILHTSGDTAMTIAATLSEDPADWAEVVAYWPRYQTPVVVSEIEYLSLVEYTNEAMLDHLRQSEEWIVVDFNGRRLLTSPSMKLSNRNCAFDLYAESDRSKRWPLSIHLPPWWELHDSIRVNSLASRLQKSRPASEIKAPLTNRKLLYGEPLTIFIASRIVEASKLPKVRGQLLSPKPKLYSQTVEIHRDWLMTKRSDLQGRYPRQLLHGGQEWIERVIYGQTMRAVKGCPLVAAPVDVINYESAPFGLEELVIYYNLCRELIEQGWRWLQRNLPGSPAQASSLALAVNQLNLFLRETQQQWLSQPFEGGSSPSFIIECSRRRVPRSPDIPIQGMEESEKEPHVIDCNCPICKMMAEGAFGPSFTSLDGYELELDEEFAFSKHETRQQWKEEMELFGTSGGSGAEDEDNEDDADEEDDYEDEFKDDGDEGDCGNLSVKCRGEKNDKFDDDGVGLSGEACDGEALLFQSVWNGIRTQEPIPGDSKGHLKLAFMLSEIISQLEIEQADEALIVELNRLFQQYRHASDLQRRSAALQLIELLELLTMDFPRLISRLADLQSYLNQPAAIQL